MAIIYKSGGLLSATETYIAHQVNCQGVMGSGVALCIKQAYPEAYFEYVSFCETQPYKNKLLGSVQLVKVAPDRVIINIFGQTTYGRNPNVIYTSHEALEHAFTQLDAGLPQGRAIAMPYKIGCGYGNGDWETVLKLIEKCFTRRNVVLISID